MKKILLIYPIYKFIMEEIENINYLAKKVDSEFVSISVLSDNPSINDELNSNLETDLIDFRPTKSNKGKYQVIKDYIDRNDKKSIFVKIVDPDDVVLIEQLNELVKFINLKDFDYDDAPMIKMNPSKEIEFSGTMNLFDVNINFHNYEARINYSNRNIYSVVNWTTVIPYKSLKDSEIIAPNQTKSSDALQGLSHFVFGNGQIVETDINFYIYNFRNGITSAINFNNDYFQQMKNFLKIMSKYKSLNKTTSPNKYDYAWSHNYLLSSGMNEVDIENELEEIYYLLVESCRDNFAIDGGWDSDNMKSLRKNIYTKRRIDY